MVGSICTMVLPPQPAEVQAAVAKRKTNYSDPLQDDLLTFHRIQVPIWGIAGRPGRCIRISAQLYNCIEQYEFLANWLKIVLQEERDLLRDQ
jgi:hypothetical protein